ncbi:DNA polymerase III subunit gamma/tau [Paracoccus sp. p4-l81]|uniref:DNA polymerase III subunit gamma/tau n=1 Tax=unclassified Paracoccus (in: a-proteobacteria) TaxID=2688777 RepID=UPI0035BA2523
MTSDTTDSNYQVLARKYRPETFADLVGQDAMVRTLKNAFAADRIAHAFILTGIRGTGKTTTARIIAKGLNCTGADGTGGPTTEPCGVCDSCRAIAEGRHVDVLEMDAASRTGVGDIREIIDSVHYRAASARYKVYIIDEVHMLSTSAFNALLKTLEEPPAHVKFIFATTEIRKVPVTVLSRCQRFDLKRIEPEVMIALMRRIAGAEGAAISDDALALIARAAEGSARDATSLLDQAIAHGAGETTATQVRAMLGLADRGRGLDLFDMILRGQAAEALSELGAQYADGADPMAVLRDLAEITHWVSVLKVSPEAGDDITLSPDERARGVALAAAVPIRVLTRMWQMLLKAIEEVSLAPNAMMAAEMALIRLTHVADLPDPEPLIRRLQQIQSEGGPAPRAAPAGGGGGARAMAQPQAAPTAAPRAIRAPQGGGATALATQPAGDALALTHYARFADVVALLGRMKELRLLLDVETYVRLVRYSPGRIEFEPAPGAPDSLAGSLRDTLQRLTRAPWGVSVVAQGGAPTLAEEAAAEREAAREEAMQDDRIRAIFEAFPQARIHQIHLPEPDEPVQTPAPDSAETAPEAWDPFEDDTDD